MGVAPDDLIGLNGMMLVERSLSYVIIARDNRRQSAAKMSALKFISTDAAWREKPSSVYAM